MGYPWALTAPTWGFYDVMRDGQPFVLGRPYGSYVIEDILFKVCFPTEFHAQTAVECAVKLHGAVVNRLDEVEKIVLTTQEAAMRVINKTGPLYTPADRDHCLQNSRDYPDAAKRSDANAVQVFFTDGTATEKVAVEYPIGHPHRRREALPLLEHKFARNLRTRFPERQVRLIQELCSDQQRLEASAVQDFVGLFVI
jgi:2-methylcitrate dehydratase PrpD